MQVLGPFFASEAPPTDKGGKLASAGALFLSGVAGDWYDVAHAIPPDTHCALVNKGVVIAITDDATTLFPVGCVVVTDAPSNVKVGWVWSGSAFSPPLVAATSTIIFRGRTFARPDNGRLSLAVNLANAAMAHAVQGGDLRWLDPNKDFAWPAADGTQVPMDAPTLIAFAGAVYAA